jgi:hypothetical protein
MGRVCKESSQCRPTNHSSEPSRFSGAPSRRLISALRSHENVLAIVAMLLFANSVHSADADREQLDEESLRSYMAGEYDLIGRKPDSTATYTGHITLRDEGGVLQVTRTIEGKTDRCVARFDTVAGIDRIPVLRMHFHFDAKDYDANYRWQLILTTTRDLPATFILPARNQLGLKPFSQSTDDVNALGTRAL